MRLTVDTPPVLYEVRGLADGEPVQQVIAATSPNAAYWSAKELMPWLRISSVVRQEEW
jgi:hypothetical protein